MTRNYPFNMNERMLYNNVLNSVMRNMVTETTGMTDKEYDREYREWNEARMKVFHDEPRANVFAGLGKVVSLRGD